MSQRPNHMSTSSAVTVREAQRLDVAAERAGMSRSGFIRHAVNAAVERTERQVPRRRVA